MCLEATSTRDGWSPVSFVKEHIPGFLKRDRTFQHPFSIDYGEVNIPAVSHKTDDLVEAAAARATTEFHRSVIMLNHTFLDSEMQL